MTLVIVAILMVALFGMLTLVIDVGGLLSKRRSMVTAADAAALAAAESCAVGSANSLHPGGPPAGSAESAADAFATQNASGTDSGATNIIASTNCLSTGSGSGRVTVRYTAPQQIFFGPVIGTGNSSDVSATATAEWGPVTQSRIIPVLVYQSQLASCGIPNTPPPPGGTTLCTLTYTHGSIDSNSWDFLDLSTLGTAQDGDTCHVSAATLKGQISGYPTSPLVQLNDPPPTPVCVDNGKSVSVDMQLVDGTWTFPVVQDVATDPYVSPNTLNVVAFITLHVDTLSHSPDVILTTEWSGDTVDNGGIGNGSNYGKLGVRLCDPSITSSCITSP